MLENAIGGNPLNSKSHEAGAEAFSLSSIVGEARLAFLKDCNLPFQARSNSIGPPTDSALPHIKDSGSDVVKSVPPAELSLNRQLPSKIKQVADDDFAALASAIIPRISHGKDYLTRNDINEALLDPAFKGVDAQILGALYQNFDRLKVLDANGKWFDETLSSGDLEIYDRIQHDINGRFAEALQAKVWTAANMSKLDSDADNSLSVQELLSAKAEFRSASDQNELEYLLSHYLQIKAKGNLQVSDLVVYLDSISNEGEQAKLTFGVWSACFKVHENQIQGFPQTLYASRDPLKSIVPDAIRQGTIGDCYFLAPLAALANSHPEAIAESIRANTDKSFTVRFAAYPDEPITVAAPTEAEQGLFNHSGPYGLWACVMEKAYGAFCQKFFWRRSITNLIPAGTPESAADGGGFMESQLALLSGRQVEWRIIKFCNEASMDQLLKSSLCGAQKKPVTAGINRNLFSQYTNDGFYRQHVYTVLDYIPSPSGVGGEVLLRNPWGGKNRTTDGVIQIPLKKFMKNFSRIAVVQ